MTALNRLFNKSQILTIPNLLSFLRLVTVPFIIWAYMGLDNQWLAIGLVALSGLTDIVDGKIARRFNMISDFGKILDPIADKVTQGTLIICLSAKYKLMVPLVILFALKEAVMLAMGYIILKRQDSVNSAKWYGKVNTAILYATAIILIMFSSIPSEVATILIVICGCFIIFSLIRYMLFYKSILSESGDEPSEIVKE